MEHPLTLPLTMIALRTAATIVPAATLALHGAHPLVAAAAGFVGYLTSAAHRPAHGASAPLPALKRQQAIALQNKHVFDSVADGIIGVDTERRITFMNAAAERLTGWQEAEVVGLGHDHVLGVVAHLFDTSPSSARQPPEYLLPRRGGAPIPVEIQASPILERRAMTGWVVLFRDVRDRHRADETQKLAAAVLEWSAQAIIVTDLQGTITTVNPAFVHLSGFAAQAAIGQPIGILHSDRHAPQFYADLWAALDRDGVWRGEMWNRAADGTLFATWVSMTRITSDGGRTGCHVAFYFDITDRKRQEERVLAAANQDALTGLPNRRAFHHRLEEMAMAGTVSGEPFALLLLDLDGFKQVNDTHGHDAGDAVLKVQSERMRGVLRASDMVARLGGDEFTVLLRQGLDGATAVAGKLIDGVAQPVPFAGVSLQVTASVGIAIFPTDGKSPEAVLKAADTAMYAVKRDGRAGYRVFGPALLDDQHYNRRSIEDALQHAFDHDELTLLYQPVVDLRRLVVAGFEGLLRWRRDDGSELVAGQIIPLVRKVGLEATLCRWALTQVVRRLVAWRDSGFPDLVLTLNAGTELLETPHFAEDAVALLAQAGVPADHVELDIPEGLFGQAGVETAMNRLGAAGIRLSLDDFSGRLTTLGVLAGRQRTRIKMSRGLLYSQLTEGPGVTAVLRSITAMAEGLGVEMVAKGLERPEHIEAALAARCHYGQGFVIARPMPPEQTQPFMLTFNQTSSWRTP